MASDEAKAKTAPKRSASPGRKETPAKTAEPATPSKDVVPQSLRLPICVVGIWGCFWVYGLKQEAVFRFKTESGEKFTQTPFLLVCEHGISALIALIVMVVFGQNTHQSLGRFLKSQAGIAAAQFGAKFCSNESLKSVSYPIQALFKSSKTLPAMVGCLVSGKKITIIQWISAIAICSGTAGFSLLGKPVKGGLEASAIGVALLLAALAGDGTVSMLQEGIRKMENPINAYEQMFMTNAGAAVFAIPPCLTGAGAGAVAFLMANPALLQSFLLCCVCSGFGQIFIFLTISWFGPDDNAKITTIRKMGTVLFSILWYGTPMAIAQWGCVALVFIAVAAEAAEKMLSKKKVAPEKKN